MYQGSVISLRTMGTPAAVAVSCCCAYPRDRECGLICNPVMSLTFATSARIDPAVQQPVRYAHDYVRSQTTSMAMVAGAVHLCGYVKTRLRFKADAAV